MKLVYVSKNSWWDARKARKVLLPLAMSGLPETTVLLVNAAQSPWSGERHSRLWQHPETGMSVLTPVRPLPLQRLGVVRKWNQWFRWRQIRRQLASDPAATRAATRFILSDPEDVHLADLIRQAGYLCYFDWTEKWDDYAAAAGDEAQSRTDANGILLHVDGVIVVSKQLAHAADALGLRCLHLPNAVSDAFLHALSQQEAEPPRLQGIPSPRMMHVGSCNPNWIHWDWLIHAAEQHPGVSFCMLGGGGEQRIPGALPANIHLLGRVRYEEIPGYLQHADGCMLLYRVEATSAGDPTKLYEYLATGLPIVSSPHPRCLEFAEELYLSDSPAGFSESISRALQEDEARARLRIDEARQCTWSLRARALRAWLDR